MYEYSSIGLIPFKNSKKVFIVFLMGNRVNPENSSLPD